MNAHKILLLSSVQCHDGGVVDAGAASMVGTDQSRTTPPNFRLSEGLCQPGGSDEIRRVQDSFIIVVVVGCLMNVCTLF
jgi:hypothetical protein